MDTKLDELLVELVELTPAARKVEWGHPFKSASGLILLEYTAKAS